MKPVSERSTCGWSETAVAGGALLIENMPNVFDAAGTRAQRITLYGPNGVKVSEMYLTQVRGIVDLFDVPHSTVGCLCVGLRPGITGVEL